MATVFLRFPGGKSKAFTMSYDDGLEQDRKLIEIMDKNGLKGTFNLNSGLFAPEGTVYPEGQIHRIMTAQQALELYSAGGHEVAVHALTHPWLEQIPSAQVAYEIIEDRRRLEKMFHCTVRGMAYPFGTYSDEVVRVLEHVQIAYSRTTETTERFNLPKDWLRMPATCHHKSPKLMELGKQFLELQAERSPQLFYLWGHSNSFEADQNWNVIEEFAALIGNQEDIWYATNIQIYDYVQAFHQLRFSIEVDLVENPTAYELYFSCRGKDYCVKPGESISING